MIVLWGSNARETHPIFFHHVLKGVRNGARLYVGRPAPHRLRAVGRRLARHRRRHRHRPRQHDRPRDHPARACTTRSSSSAPRPDFEEYAALGRGVDARARRARDRRARATLIQELAHAYARADRARDLLDARHHRAPQRRRQRPRADQPRPAHRPRRPLRLGPEPAARAEQRPGRRRHGRDPEQAARLPGHRARRRGAASGSARRGASRSCPKYGWHLTQMFEAMERGELTRALRHRREPGPVRGRRQAHARAARGPRAPGRPGHLPHPHRRDGRRRAARRRRAGARPRARSRTASGGCSACARRSTRPAGARDDIEIICELAKRLGHDWGYAAAEDAWDELRSALADARAA